MVNDPSIKFSRTVVILMASEMATNYNFTTFQWRAKPVFSVNLKITFIAFTADYYTTMFCVHPLSFFQHCFFSCAQLTFAVSRHKMKLTPSKKVFFFFILCRVFIHSVSEPRAVPLKHLKYQHRCGAHVINYFTFYI